MRVRIETASDQLDCVCVCLCRPSDLHHSLPPFVCSPSSHLAVMSAPPDLSSVGVDPSSSPPSSPAQRLYPDLLYCLFSFFDFKELLSPYATCRSWRDALVRQPCRQVVLAWPLSFMGWFRHSPLRHHASTYNGSGSVQDLALLNALPSLTAIRCSVDAMSFVSLVMRSSGGGGIPRDAAISSLFPTGWPLKLRSLSLQLSEESQQNMDWRSSRELPAIIQALVDCAARYASISELKLTLAQRPVTFQPLLQLESLTQLDIEGPKLILKDIEALKYLTQLERLGFNNGEVPIELMRALCSGPQEKGQLRSLRLDHTNCTVEHLECLQRLPHLTALSPMQLALAALPMLPSFSKLQVLSLFVTDDLSASVFLPHLCECAQLTDLQLVSWWLTQVDVSQLATGMPGLRRLCFQGASFTDHDPGLSLLRELANLESLSIYECEGIELAQLIDEGLASMRSLSHLSATFHETELPAARKLFKVPSRIMPFLKSSDIRLEPAA